MALATFGNFAADALANARSGSAPTKAPTLKNRAWGTRKFKCDLDFAAEVMLNWLELLCGGRCEANSIDGEHAEIIQCAFR